MAQAAPDEQEHGAHNAQPQKHRDFSDGRDASVKKDDKEDDQPAGKSASLPVGEWMQILGIVGETDRSRSHRKRRLNQCLPDKKKRHQPPPTLGAVRFTQKNVGAARLRHRGSQFRPHKAIETSEKRSRKPGKKSLRAAHRLDDQRTDNERADPNDLDHVERYGLFEPEAALELRLGAAGASQLIERRHAQRE